MIRYILVFSILLSLAASCHRGGDSNSGSTMPSVGDNLSKISADDPFEGQPNTFCTVIRKVAAAELGKKQDCICLLDVCLDEDEAPVYSVNLGTAEEPVLAAYKLIKIFDSRQDALAYAAEYQIVDVVLD
ncbi:MAG TPA: hypothetical protein DHW15_03385 [Bacteroidetes bacterium]|jgi:hypothetical protein|nr:MAG: hypothetical protein ABR94_02055 [Sphingobacteriales bacterium BACL12 MAG-120802-bin5]KRP06995.1 MAG: hypothetical protein ABR95_12950 [Sphingobacteriales bacterium BACL12 MAG-120813-bin55]HCK21220.1 hypothetical protein [Bacteroidota bacterium]